MKERQCFVSNSSSSSFVIFFKGTKTDLRKRLEEAFKLPESYPLDIIKTSIIADAFIRNSEQKSIKDLIEDHYWENDDPEYLAFEEKITSGFKVYDGSFSNDSGNSLESMLCESNIKYVSEDLVIEKEGGY